MTWGKREWVTWMRRGRGENWMTEGKRNERKEKMDDTREGDG